MGNETFSKPWELLKRETATRRAKFVEESEAACRELVSLVQGHIQEAGQVPLPVLDPGKVDSLRDLIEGPAQTLLFDTITRLRKTRAQERALAALEAYRGSIDDLIRRLPKTLSLSDDERTEVLGIGSPGLFRRFGDRARRKRPFALRQIVELHLLEQANAQASWLGGCFLLLAEASLLALAAWQDLRGEAMPALLGQPLNEESAAARRRSRESQAAALSGRLTKLLAELHDWNSGAEQRLARALQRGRSQGETRRTRKLTARSARCFRFWSRQQRAITAVVDLEWEMTRLTLEVARGAKLALKGLGEERAELLNELDSVIAWLRSAQAGESGDGFPPPAAKLATAEDRATEWQRLTEAATRSRLPERMETIEPRWSLPPRRSPWRTLEPQKSFLTGLARFSREKILAGFQEAEGAHRAILREIERAREVVAFSRESASAEGPAGDVIVREGLANALSLVSFQKENAIDPAPAVEATLVEGLASALIFAHLSLEQRRLGVWKQLATERGSSAMEEIARLAAEGTSAKGRWVREALRAGYHHGLQRIGWETPPVTTLQPVVARSFFDEFLDLKAGPYDLPMIYRRLFRLAPLEDPRFLVGREAEMMALTRARELWQAGRAVDVILVGARGSGKTSLLNCATSLAFADVPVVRSQFQKRITNALQMRQFLHRLFEVPESEDLLGFLRKRKMVVMLEELERTFLRCMNGFEGLKELLSIISSTAGTTLWILSINQRSYRYLDAAVGLGPHFSHRINATAVAKDDLRNAILLRHHLSGLRLQYPPVPKRDPRVSRIRRFLGLSHSPQEMFFDSLYLQSEGVFRSAFELWQHFVERVEGGVLYFREPLEPNFDPMIHQLTLDDAFALQAIVQHGHLTTQEHAAVFECPVAESRMRLEKLLGLELLEQEPGASGLRVRPEAGRIVHIVLHRRNLV